MAKQSRIQHTIKPGQRAKKSRCAVCHRVIPQGKPCPLAPHIVLTNGHVIRPIKHNDAWYRTQHEEVLNGQEKDKKLGM